MITAKTNIIVIAAIFITSHGNCQQADTLPIAEQETEMAMVGRDKKLNFFIISKRKKGSLDLASRFNVFRSKLKSLFRQKKFVAIVARDGQEATAKIRLRLDKYNARIGTLWFDSHGMYKKGYSLFFIGKDEYSYKTLKDSVVAGTLKELSPYSDNESKIVIGSCYGGATYERASIDYKDTTRMNGDSLMMAMGNIFSQASIYGSESWVMTKPGLFLEKAAVAGHPSRKLFRDVCYQPAWKHVGVWNEYRSSTDSFARVNPITMDMYGNLVIRADAYADKERVRKEIDKKMDKLKPGLYK